ncbi:hypothetical protein ACFWN2_07245 [Lentzea sp. NPDC058436]|uniref:hypothetical protein n=1 Tax=Lentzea sp. NPDC058436 TaxID=3346499 RepID=UPI003661C3BB
MSDFPPQNLPDHLVPGFGIHVRSTSSGRPAYLGVTTIETRSEDERQEIGRRGPALAAELRSVPGFLGATLFVAGDRMFTVSSWADETGPRLLGERPGPHRDAVRQVVRDGFTLGGAHSLWRADSVRMLARCGGCRRINDTSTHDRCQSCGTELPGDWCFL